MKRNLFLLSGLVLLPAFILAFVLAQASAQSGDARRLNSIG
jgi:hypothetical protein